MLMKQRSYQSLSVSVTRNCFDATVDTGRYLTHVAWLVGQASVATASAVLAYVARGMARIFKRFRVM
jgi:hypothetical protein